MAVCANVVMHNRTADLVNTPGSMSSQASPYLPDGTVNFAHADFGFLYIHGYDFAGYRVDDKGSLVLVTTKPPCRPQVDHIYSMSVSPKPGLVYAAITV